jgi:hypothetical protein
MYDENGDWYTFPIGHKMNFIQENIRISDNGFRQVNRLYQAQDCNGCPVRQTCNKSKGNKENRNKSKIKSL